MCGAVVLSACFVCLLYLFICFILVGSVQDFGYQNIYVNLLDFFFIHILSIWFDSDAVHLFRKSSEERHKKEREKRRELEFTDFGKRTQKLEKTGIPTIKIDSLF